MKNWFVVLVVFFVFGCSETNYDNAIDDGLKIYLDRFVSEGADRNFTIDLEAKPISVIFGNIQGGNILGQCVHNTEKPNQVVIDRIFWKTLTESDKEFVMFHELGHCILNRNHLDTKDSLGNCVSIMHSSLDACPFEYNDVTRRHYLDELFQ